MRVLIINNLVSGIRDGAIYDFARLFSRDGDEVMIRSTDGTTLIENQLHDFRDFDLVVASGGDSTVGAVAYEMRYSDIPILPFPAGTANLLAMNLKTPQEPSALAAMARKQKTEYYDLGEMSFERDGQQVTRGFAVMAGAGFDADLIRNSERLKESFGPMSYYVAAITVLNPTVAQFRITLDDEILEIDGIAVLLVNFSEIAEDLSIIHANDASDGLLEVVVIKKRHTIELLPSLIAAALDSTGRFPDRADAFEIRQAKRVLVESDPPLPLQFDGELPLAQTPYSVSVLPGAARIVVS